jgi:hypothetical protein
LCSGTNENYNSVLNTPGGGSGSNDRTNSAASNPFVSWTSGDFNLTGENTDLHGGVTLSSPYDIDPNGNTRGTGGTWSRGAYEFGSGSTAQKPNPPQNLQAVVSN